MRRVTHRVRMTRSVFELIGKTIGELPAEQGGALGRDEADDIVRHYRYDDTARRTGATYSPDHRKLNEMFRTEWNPAGIRLVGFVHSHPSGCARPSSGDQAYAERILTAIPDLPYLFLPIVQTVPDTGAYALRPFVAVRSNGGVTVEPVELDLVEDREADPAFAKVDSVYDLDRLAASRVVAVGTGGGAAFVEDLARCGVGEFVLIDADVVSLSNVATQQVYRRDLGRPKISTLAERIRDINPRVILREVPSSLDELDDASVEALLHAPLRGVKPVVTLVCGLTDSFAAQARVNALALHFGVPSLCAQVWAEGRAAEVTFTYPGLTPACHRCVLVTRYRANLSPDYHNTVTSAGTPIFATARLNALKGYVALALLHYRPDVVADEVPGGRFVGLAERMATRNLAIIRLDPDLSQTLKFPTFDRVLAAVTEDAVLFDETIWRKGTPEDGSNGDPICPDCGGTGDLAAAQGTFADTRQLRR